MCDINWLKQWHCATCSGGCTHIGNQTPVACPQEKDDIMKWEESEAQPIVQPEQPPCQWCGGSHVVLNPKTQDALPCPYCQLLGGECINDGIFSPFGAATQQPKNAGDTLTKIANLICDRDKGLFSYPDLICKIEAVLKTARGGRDEI